MFKEVLDFSCFSSNDNVRSSDRVKVGEYCSGVVSSITGSLSTCLLPNTGCLGLVGVPCLITVGTTGLTSPLGGTGGGNTDTVEWGCIGTSLFSSLLNLSIHLLVGLA